MSTRYDELTKILGTGSAGTPSPIPDAEEQKQTSRRDELYSLLVASEPEAPATADTGASTTQSSPVLEKPKQETLQQTTPQSPAATAPLKGEPLSGRSAEQIQQEISDSRNRLAKLQSDAAYVLTAEPGAELGRQMDAERARIKALNEELNALNAPNTNAERDSMIQRMNDITANEGYATTVELADAVTQEKQDTRQRLHQLDEELGNAARFYDSGERAGAVTKGALKQTGSAYTNFMGTLQGVGNRLNELSPDENAALYGIDYGELEKEEQRIYEKADTTAESAARDIEQAKEGLSALGKAGVDISTNLIQMGIDAAGRAAGLGMLPFFVRAAGGSMQEARQAGASTGQQLAYGLTKGAIEVGTEKLFDGLAGVFGKGAADDVIEGLIGKLSGSNTGRSLLRAFAGAAGEGTEEVISDLLDPFAKLIYNDRALKEAWENRAELRSQMLYDYLLGAAMGGFGSVTGAATGQYAEKNAALAEMGGESHTVETATAGATPQSAAPTAPLTQGSQTPQPDVPTAPVTGDSSPQSVASVEDVLKSGRVSNTAANNILNNASLSAQFEDITGITLDGTREENRRAIQRAAREYAYNAQTSDAAAQEEAVQAETEETIRTSGYGAYIRGVLKDGATVSDARDIIRNPEMRATWEQMTGKTLPENQKSAIKMIMQTRRANPVIPEQQTQQRTYPTVEELIRPITPANDISAEGTPQSALQTAPLQGEPLSTQQEAQAQAAEAEQEAQRATPQAETPPTTQNAAQTDSGELNLRDEGNVSSSDYDTQRLESLMFSEAPQEAVHNTDSFDAVTANNDFQNRDFNDVGNRKIKAYMYENPEVKPFFQFEAEAMLNDLKNSVKGERFYNSQLAYDSGNEYGWTGNKRLVSDDIAVLLDYGYSYEEIEKGLKAIIEDDGRENNACSKRIEFLLNDRLMDGYTDWQSNEFVPPNQEYRNMILEKQINAYSKEEFEEYLKNAERYTPKDAKINSNGQSNPQGADTVRGFSENVATDSAMEEALRREFEQNPEMYTRLANKDTLKKAQDIFTQGLDKARSELERAIGAAQSGQKFAPEMVPLSRMVANELTRQGELTAARKIISDVAAELTGAGQLGQAAAILRNADPVTVLNTLQKSIDAINAEVGKKFGKRNPWKAELTAEEIKQISETDFSQDGAFEAIQQQIAERLGREMPATWAEKLREIRKVGMLANPKTQVKNFAGNVPLAGERKIAEKLSGGLQELAVKAGIMSKEEQTRTLRVSQESKDLAKSVYKNNIDRITKKGNKGELRGILRDTRTYFNKGLLQKGIEKATGHQLNDAALDYVRRFTYDLLERGDAPFVKSAFIDSLAQYCEAQGIKSEADVTETAFSYALDQAMAATFKDASALANLLNSIKDNAGIAGQALDVLFPFTTTPINIAKEFSKYSPLGYLQLLNAKGKGTAEVIDIISRATTGSAVVAAGAILRSLGFITGAADDDKDKAAADKAAGISPYSILGKYSYEWMQPTGSALAMGASIYDAAKDGGSLIETLSNGIISAGDAYLEQSFYKDIIDLFKGYGSPTENMIRELLTGTASQFIPTIVGATARTIDPTVRTSYTGGNIIDDILAQAKVKTPGLSKSAPASVNVRGEETQRGNLAQRILDNFIFPWTTNRNGGEENAVGEAIDEVYAETGDKTIFRQVSPYKVDYGGETYKMTGEEREQFQKTQGQVHDDIIQQIIDGTLWQEMGNDAKVKTMQLANEYALDAAKRELVESRGNEYSSDWDDEAELTDVGDYLAAKTTLKAAQDSKDYTLLDALVETVTEQKKDVQEKLNKDFSMLDELIYGKQRGVDAETIYTAKTEADANGNGKISQEELWYYLGLQKNMPEETKDVLWDILTTGKTGYAQYAEKQK